MKNYTKNGPTRPKTCEVCMYYSPITKGRGVCERRVANGGSGTTLRVKTCPFYKAVKKTDQTMIFDLPMTHSTCNSSGPKELMIEAIREAEKELVNRTDNQIHELRVQIQDIITSRDNYQLGVEDAINAIRNSK